MTTRRHLPLALLLLHCGCADILGIEQKHEKGEPPPVPGARPPPRPTEGPSGPPTKKSFGARRFFFGAVDPETGQRDPNAWRKIGFDIDGVDTSEALAASDAPGTCRPPPNPELFAVLTDGEDGRDNNFGGQLLKLFASFSGSLEGVEEGANESITSGSPTLVVTLSDLAEGPNDPEVQVGLMFSAPGGPPMWNGVDRFGIDSRAVRPKSLTPNMLFTKGYMTENVVVTGDFNAPSEATFLMPFDPLIGAVILRPRTFTLTLELDETHEAVRSSTLSMVLTIADVAEALSYYAHVFAGFACDADPTLLYWILGDYADLSAARPEFLDATGTTACDALSVAFRVDWSPVRNPVLTDVKDVNPDKDPCDLP
jgi:hypothetical protein